MTGYCAIYKDLPLFYIGVTGYPDQGAYLRSEYQEDGSVADPSYDFEQDIDRLWREVRPLYEQLHAYARRRLQTRYTNETFPQTGHIPAHLLGV